MQSVKRTVFAAMVCAAGCSAALAQTDVIVGDLYDRSNYTDGVGDTGPIGGVHAYSVGTYSCNIGNQPLTWVDSPTSAVYPVISQNMYRLTNGRFEQIGQAWLKHGFCALNNPLCQSCPTGSGCDTLMPGCADPYGSGLNGQQSGLGPKHVVNPATGVFPSSHTAPSLVGTSAGDATLKARLQVAQADMTSTAALYFVSSTYIHPQDATNNTDNNNQSYRRVTIANSGGTPNYAMTLVDSTAREKPAIEAWRDHGGGVGIPDATVVLTPVDIAGDGRFIIGSKAIDIGGGLYRYEYAVYNHNSHRGASGFSVPLLAGTTISAGSNYFHDVPYHSGELQNGADWNFTGSATSAAWNYVNGQTDDRVENVLRWDSIYNFSFVCDRQPTTGNVTLTMFTGSPGTVPVSAVVPGTGTGGGTPGNDACATPTLVGLGTTAINTTGATTDGPNECVNASYAQIGNDVWFSLNNGSCLNPITVTTCGSSFDTKIAVYTNACPTADNTAIACNDDTTGCTGGSANLGSSVTFTPLANTMYRIRVGGYASGTNPPASGLGTLNITQTTCGPVAPANDACTSALWAAAGVTYTGSTALATDDGTSSCGNASASADVWYKYQPQTTGSVSVATCGSSYDTVVSVHSACGASNITNACNDDACAGGGGNLGSTVTMNMTAGTTYLIRVTGYQGATGDYSLIITGGGGVVPPSNDNCNGRIGIAGSTPFSTVGATTDGVSTPTCGQVFNEIWYNYPAQCTGTATITAVGSGGFAPSLAVYDGGTCAATYMACADAVSGTATINVPVTHLNSYTIRIGGNATGLTGSGTLTISCTPSGPVCDSIDFNGDGLFPDTLDLDDYVSVFGGGGCSNDPNCGDIDFNNDGLFPDTLDIDSLLSVFSGGACL